MTLAQLYDIFLHSKGVTTDTREDVRDKIFFALKGNRFDGHTYVPVALEKGCRLAVTDRSGPYPGDPQPGRPEGGGRIVRVESVLETLQQLAAHHRRQSRASFIAITGSNGKTTTKELLARILGKKYKILSTRGNLNNHIGVPLTLLSVKGEQVVLVEMGANHAGEIGLLSRIAAPGLGLITNVGKAHLEGFGSLEGVLEAKGELYEYLATTGGSAFVDADDPMLRKKAESTGVETILIGEGEAVPVSAHVKSQSPFLEVELRMGSRKERVATRLVGAYNLQNILLAAGIGHYYKVPGTAICEALATYEPQNQRSQLLEGKHHRLVLDAYNANPTSMRDAIRSFLEYSSSPRMLILGDMAEVGTDGPAEHRALTEWVNTLPVDRILLVGDQFSRTAEPSDHLLVFRDKNELAEYLGDFGPGKYDILLKGSRFMGLEQLVPLLAE